ncbi:MAG TPA: BNR-4 repeat-containing protein [Actinomycetes bacterium]
MALALVTVLAAALVAAPDAGALPLRRREAGASGAWSWFGDPRAVYYQGAHRRTYVGWIDHAGSVQVTSYDHDTKVRVTATIKARFQRDDHNNPSLLVRPDGHLIAFWSAHIGGRMYYRRTVNPEDVTTWGPEQHVPTNTGGGSKGYTYPNPVQLSAENNRLWLFWRGGNFNPSFSTSDDEVHWAPARTLISVPGQRPYAKYASNGTDTIHVAFTQGHPRDVATNIYYVRYRAGNLQHASGRLIAPLSRGAITPSQADHVYTAALHHGQRAWVHDVAADAAGRPVVTYASFPSTSDHRYHYSRWTGSRWVDHEIARAGGSMSVDPGEPHYSGGITLDHEDPSYVYLSRKVHGHFEVSLWHTRDGGHSWTSRPVTGGSARGNYRPVSPRGRTGPDMNVVWMRGGYPSYLTYQTGVDAEVISHDAISPAAASWDRGRVDVLAAEGGGLIHKSYAGAWSDWAKLPGGPGGHRLSAPAVTSQEPGRLDAFATDAVSGHLLHSTFDGGVWSTWVDRGAGPHGHRVGQPAATSAGPGLLDVIARDGVTGQVVHWKLAAGTWRGPSAVASSPGGSWVPSVASWAPGRLDVFTVNSHGGLDHLFHATRWSRWEHLASRGPGGLRYASPVAVTAWGPRRLDVFATNSGRRLVEHRWFDGMGGGGWRGRELLGTGPDRLAVAGMAVASWAPRRLDVFTSELHAHGLLHYWFSGRWNGPERQDFAGQQVAVLADASPRAVPAPVNPLAREFPED